MFKRNKTMNLKAIKKTSKFKIIFYLIIVYLSFAYTFYYSIKSSNTITNKEFINLILSKGNANINNDYSLINIVNDTVNFLFNIDFKSPSTILNKELLASGKKNNEIDIMHDDDYSDMEELKKISSYIEDPNPVDINNPIIYIYNSHQLENYSNKSLDIYGITPNVLMASYILKEKLNTMGLSTVVETTNLTDFLNANGWNHASSYKASRLLILNNKSKYNTLKYFIDIHRDSVSKEVATININNKNYARILFVVGLEHDNYQKNLDNMNALNKLCEKYYPGLSRGIYKKSGPGVNGIYNQDINEFTMLIEVGSYTNTIDEVFNTIEALSNILYKYIKGENI
ncbi:MAG: stage II sporulation protein P [Bacilli bacterium]|nr:stage II sporulation protein P [Bacilli bacterium]